MDYVIDFSRRMSAQVKKMLVDKFDEGVRIYCDPGDEFLLQWPLQKGGIFSNKWKNCLCRTCISCIECGFKTASECKHYEFDESLIEKYKNEKKVSDKVQPA